MNSKIFVDGEITAIYYEMFIKSRSERIQKTGLYGFCCLEIQIQIFASHVS